MAKFAALMLWTDAWIADTKHLSRTERGTYHDLLVLMWRSPGCRVPNDDAWLGKHLGMTQLEVMVELRPIISEFCQNDGNYITQKRLQHEFYWSKKISRSQSVRAKRRWDKEKDVCRGNATPGNASVTVTVTTEDEIEAEASISPPNSKKKTRFEYPPGFETFWQHYPRSAGKDGAHKAWRRVIDTGKATNEELIAGAMRYAADPNRDPSFTKHAATWLNAGCQNDGPLPARGGQGNGQHGRRHGSVLDALDRIGERLKEAGATDDYIPGTSGPRPLHEIEPSLGRPKPRELDQEVRQPNLKLVPPR